jgi:glucose-1-phosphatase
MTTTIKNIIFDLGGVLLDIDYHKTANAFKALGAADFDSFYSQAGANELFEQLETGHISEADFCAAMLQHCHAGTTQQQVIAAWNAILLHYRLPSVQFVLGLQAHYNVYLLSNTNAIHQREFYQSFTTETGLPHFDMLFKKAYFSHSIHQRKPYVATYQWVLQDAGIEAAETLFIDDSPVNITGAKDAGLICHLLLPGQTVEDLPYFK